MCLGVPQPRLIRPNAVYAISRRTQDREFILRPDAILTTLFTWVLAVTARQCGVDVHVAVCMSTHFHLVVSVAHENVSQFMNLLDLRLAKSLQVLRKLHRGVVWAPGELSIIELHTPEAVVEQIAYAIVNPVKCGAVHSALDWPGLTGKVQDIGRRVLSAPFPGFYFDVKRWADEDASLPLLLPRWLAELGEQRAHAVLQAEVDRQEVEARALLGKVAVQNLSPYRQATSWEEIGKLVPHIAAGRGQKEARKAAIAELVAFRIAYRAALERWRAGHREVVFPPGTYWMRVHHGVQAAPFS